jgi:hypothetical protein
MNAELLNKAKDNAISFIQGRQEYQYLLFLLKNSPELSNDDFIGIYNMFPIASNKANPDLHHRLLTELSLDKSRDKAYIHVVKNNTVSQSLSGAVKINDYQIKIFSPISTVINTKNSVLFHHFCIQEGLSNTELETGILGVFGESNFDDLKFRDINTTKNIEHLSWVIENLISIDKNLILKMPKLIKVMIMSYSALQLVSMKAPELLTKIPVVNKIIEPGSVIGANIIKQYYRDLAYSLNVSISSYTYHQNDKQIYKKQVRSFLKMIRNKVKGEGDIISSYLVSDEALFVGLKSYMEDNSTRSAYRQAYSESDLVIINTFVKYIEKKLDKRFYPKETGTELSKIISAYETDRYRVLAKIYAESIPLVNLLELVKTSNQLDKLKEIYAVNTMELMSCVTRVTNPKAKRFILSELSNEL